MNITIVGRSNNYLSFVLDALFERFKTSFNVEIIQNVEVKDTSLYKLEKTDAFLFEHINSETWNGKFEHLIMGVGKPTSKKLVFAHFSTSHNIKEVDFFSLCHPASTISLQSTIEHGVFIGPGSVITPYARIGSLVTINRNVSVGHHTEIGQYSTINPGVNIGGETKIGDCVTIGMGANIIDGVSVGDNTIIGAGSLVTKSLPENVMAYGVPAKVIKENINK